MTKIHNADRFEDMGGNDLFATKEALLGYPAISGMTLQSTTSGTRSWVLKNWIR